LSNSINFKTLGPCKIIDVIDHWAIFVHS
jgi:hypothetical protein